MSNKKRKTHSAEFKAKIGLEALSGLKTINEIGQAYEVHPVQVRQWKKAIQDQAKRLFEGKRGPKKVVEHQDPERLYSEIGKLKVELDWLKKSLGSAYRDAPLMDQSRRRIAGYAPMCLERSLSNACLYEDPSSRSV